MTYSWLEVMIMIGVVSAVCTLFGFCFSRRMFKAEVRKIKKKEHDLSTCDLVWNDEARRFACNKCGYIERGIEDERLFDPLFWKYCPNCGLPIVPQGEYENDDSDREAM